MALPKEITIEENITPCIRCNLCVEACPTEISPVMITLAAEKDLFDIASEWGTEFCIECGNCSYVCPAKRPMMELIRYAKTHLDQEQQKQALPVSTSLFSLSASEASPFA